MTWNGYGLSFWRCKCGARSEGLQDMGENSEHITRVEATASCKRCGDTGEPATWPDDPWLGLAS
jgi:hypothetical protein